MKISRIIILSFITAICYGCSTEESVISPVEPPVNNASDNVYFTHNQWIYSQMNQHYLWREDLPDSLSCNYDQSPDKFYKSILSDKDRFSYMFTNPIYDPNTRSGIGFSYQTYRDNKNNTASLVLYVSNRQVSASGIRRGDWLNIISLDNSTLTYSKVTVSDGFFIYDDNVHRMSLPTTPENTVLLDSIYANSIGYLCYTDFDDIADLVPVITKFKEHNITDLILDLRYNPGGYVKTCKYLTNCIAPEQAYGDIFQITKYNDRISLKNISKTGSADLYNYYGFPVSDPDKVIKGENPIIPLNLSRLYVLTSSHSASASEAAMVCLKPYMEVIQIGETTVGKGVGSYSISDNKYKYALQPITMQYYNKNEETTPNTGLVPDYYIADGYITSKKEIGDIEEPLLKAALELILGGSISPDKVAPNHNNIENSLTPVGEPSYLIEFKNKYYNENF